MAMMIILQDEHGNQIEKQEFSYKLTSKSIYCRSNDSIPLWEGAEDMPDCIRQLDGFHLARACSRGWEKGNDMYSAIRCGRARRTLGALKS
jgi:hypothetical protein